MVYNRVRTSEACLFFAPVALEKFIPTTIYVKQTRQLPWTQLSRAVGVNSGNDIVVSLDLEALGPLKDSAIRFTTIDTTFWTGDIGGWGRTFSRDPPTTLPSATAVAFMRCKPESPESCFILAFGPRWCRLLPDSHFVLAARATGAPWTLGGSNPSELDDPGRRPEARPLDHCEKWALGRKEVGSGFCAVALLTERTRRAMASWR
ncbi:hypothetical protein QBC39DRAFT_356502 [Podospora conica]|nr:hypothetical protein QBC39DRAFT_356502 [Schizothecium conicum]